MKTTILKVTCDLCGAECAPLPEGVTYPRAPENPAKVVISFSVHGENRSYDEVCKLCCERIDQGVVRALSDCIGGKSAPLTDELPSLEDLDRMMDTMKDLTPSLDADAQAARDITDLRARLSFSVTPDQVEELRKGMKEAGPISVCRAEQPPPEDHMMTPEGERRQMEILRVIVNHYPW